jgi:hypothetical protein
MKLFLLIPLVFLLTGCRTNESPEGQVNDLEITTQVKSKLAAEIGLSSVANVGVNSTNGIVTLSGQVDTDDAKTKATGVTTAVPKVVRVVNNLQVVPRKVKGRSRMLWTIFVILLVLWLLGMVTSYTMAGYIHILLVIAVVVLIIRLIQGRRVV